MVESFAGAEGRTMGQVQHGSAPTAAARLLAERLRGRYAANMVVENRTGAAGRLAIEELKRAEPDGATALFAPASMLTILPSFHAWRLRHDVSTDLAPVTPTCIHPLCRRGRPRRPGVTTLAELVAFARFRGEVAIGHFRRRLRFTQEERNYPVRSRCSRGPHRAALRPPGARQGCHTRPLLRFRAARRRRDAGAGCSPWTHGRCAPRPG